jgi:hypothetical protein
MTNLEISLCAELRCVREQNAELWKERDELLEALKRVCSHTKKYSWQIKDDWDNARKLLKKTEVRNDRT